MASPEILAVLADEVADAAAPLAGALAEYAAAGDPAQGAAIGERYREQVSRLAATADVLSLSGLRHLCAHITDNTAVLDGSPMPAELPGLLGQWPDLVIGYLRAPKDGVYSRELADYCRDSGWPRPMGADEAGDLTLKLTAIADAVADAEERPSRPTEARPEDVLLDIAPDVNPALVEAFLAEAPLLAGAYTSLVENVIRGGAGPDTLNEARRHVHSIKGAANTIGVRGIVQLTHHLEDLLEYLGQRSITPQDGLAKLLMDAADCLEMMLESLLDNAAPPPQAQLILQRLLDIANAIDRGEEVESWTGAIEPAMAGVEAELPDVDVEAELADTEAEQELFPPTKAAFPAPAEAQLPALPEIEFLAPTEAGSAGRAEPEAPAAQAVRPAKAVAAVTPPAPSAPAAAPPSTPAPATRAPIDVARAIRVAVATIDDMLRLSGEMTIGRAHIQERLHQAFALTADLREHQTRLQTRAADIERLVTVQGVAAGQKTGSAGVGIFDALEMDQYSELHGAVHGLVETASDVQTLGTRVLDALAVIETAVTQQGLVNAELHEHIMRARMVPASVIEPRLARTVRQVCDATGKSARLDFQGGDVMLDDHAINDLINPLVHLLRNAVDHGLEPPQRRLALGKSEHGNLRLAFAREGSHIVIRCEDDGAGLDLHRIHAMAVRRGLVAENADLSETEIANLILVPGFSTTDNVSEISGRGVGMDIVHTAIRKLKGTLDIQTHTGKGSRFVLRLPLMLGSAHCLVVRSGEMLAAIPTDTLDRVVFAGTRYIERLGGNWVFHEERERCDVRDLAELLGQPASRALGDAGDARPVVVVNDADNRQAVVVDALLSGRDLVIKHLGSYLAGARGVVGASLLGDGRVLPVLDMHELLRMRRGDSAGVRPQVTAAARLTPARAPTNILVVDDSLSVRQALTQLLEDDGYQVHTAKDGVEALEYLAKERPAALLVDLEMPRMNGLELTERLRSNQDMRQLPVIMVTSRTSDKHRSQARLAGVDLYLTKPYREGDLLARLRSMVSRAA